MATSIMFGTLTQAARNAVSAKRTEDAMALIKKHGVLDLPNMESTIQVSATLGRLLDINFRTAPAVGIDEFNRLAAV